MKPKIKEQWVAALRSGDYKQGKAALRVLKKKDNEVRYCCLGVLCDVLGRKWYEAEEWDQTTDKEIAYAVKSGIEKNSADLPESILNRVGLNVDQMNELIQMNDGGFDYYSHKNIKAKKFPKIADWIEKNL